MKVVTLLLKFYTFRIKYILIKIKYYSKDSSKFIKTIYILNMYLKLELPLGFLCFSHHVLLFLDNPASSIHSTNKNLNITQKIMLLS